MYMYIYTHSYIYTHTHIYIHICTYIYTLIYIYIYKPRRFLLICGFLVEVYNQDLENHFFQELKEDNIVKLGVGGWVEERN